MPIIHASAVEVNGRALLIMGHSGTGKSSLAIHLLALGCGLISDDRTAIEPRNNTLIAAPAPNIAGLIEARGIGILHAPTAPESCVAAAVDLNHTETRRMPARRTSIEGINLPLFYKSDNPAWPAALWLYLKNGAQIEA